MPCGMIARQLLDKSARQLGLRTAPRDPDLRSAKIPGAICDEPKERIGAVKADVGTLLHLVSLGFVATAVVVVFFGLGFFLLAHPGDQPIASAGLGARGAEPTAFSSSVPLAQPSEAGEQVLLVPTGDTALGALPPATANTVAANMTFNASSPEQQGLESNKETATVAANSSGIAHATRTATTRHRHNAARKHWAAAYRPPPAASGPEKAWRWIVYSAGNLLAALSPPLSRQTAGFRTH
jgi:hypothetical protein